MSPTPRMSVLVPLQDERGTADECIRAWMDQAADPESFEVIALAPREDPAMEDRVRRMLRGRDRWIVRPGRDEYDLFDVGASMARGEFILLTEVHCVPELDFVSAMLAELDRTGATGVRGASLPTLRGPFGALELEMFESAQRLEEDPDHWRKVLMHSTAIRREAFVEAGGTASRYGDFSVWRLSINLHESGERLVFSPLPRVRHTYDGDIRHVIPFVRSFRHGEVLYRGEHSPESTDRYLEWIPEWERRLDYSRWGARRALRAWVALRPRGALGTAARHGLRAVVGPYGAIAAARLRAAAAAVRLRCAARQGSQARAFREVWTQTSRQGVLEGLRRTKPAAPRPNFDPDRLDLTGSLGGRAIGLHDPESVDGEPPFRWTEPLALLWVRVPGRGRRRARLELRRSEWAMGASIRVAVDDQVVPAAVSAEAVEFELESGPHRIALGSKPIRPGGRGGDRRVLGLPVRSLTFGPARTQQRPRMREA